MPKTRNIDASFIAGTRGALLALHFRPPPAVEDRRACVIVVPAFAEEMNRCRYMQTLLAGALNARGIGLLAVDPFGTGDSQGAFGEATWEQWVADTQSAMAHARHSGYERIELLGIRLGALLALEALAGQPPVSGLVFWQPVISGKAILNQFLRLKIAASIGRDEAAGSTQEFEDMIERGEHLQVAGYDVSPGLFKGIQSAHIDQHLQHLDPPLAWFSILASAERKVPRPELAVVEQLIARGGNIAHQTLVAAPFWQAHERTLAPELIEPTCQAVDRGLGDD
ncbi:MAG: hydrolase 2, exosortase A system-associated [Parahaliea sp.]